ncbi:transcriptional regulator [Sphingobacterium sp. UBA5996]|uniref:transcriptional regulator n=1 Tax=Sphingobacterium sp. UBA5996 TaxID=1947505 RepID=UPI0025CE247A|nr:transcriptional regulator [Sphingobacterium sp. UBA5996]
MMRKYCCILLLLAAVVGNVQAQIVTTKLLPQRIPAGFDRVKEAVSDISGRNGDSKIQVTPLAATDTTATFEIEEQGLSIETVVDDEKKFNKLVAEAAKDVSKPSIHILHTYTLKDKKLKVPPPRKIFFSPEYGVTWTLTLKKIADKETELVLNYKSIAPAFAKKIELEFESDTYYNNKIVKIAVDDIRMRHLIREILIDQMHVDRDYPAPTYPASN